MNPVDGPIDFHPQDWIIIIEALAQWAGPSRASMSNRRLRAYELIETIAAEEGLPADELLRQSVDTWPQP